MAHFIMAFAPAEPGKPHPAPWKSARGGITFDILAELHVPASFAPPNWFDRLNTIWWLAALMRLHVTPLVRVPAVAASSFSTMRDGPGDPRVWLIEAEPRGLVPMKDPPRAIHSDGMEWVRQHWLSGGELMNRHENFNIAFQAFDGCHHLKSPPLALVQLWGGLEQLFTTAAERKTRQLASRISAYFEPAGVSRVQLERHVRDLYAGRCSAAHETKVDSVDALLESYELLRRILMRMIEDNHVLSKQELEILA